MTGYGKATAELPGKKLSIEIKSLNSKGLDLSVKLPGAFREKEMEIRALLSQRLDRGKVELYVSAEKSVDTPAFSINKPLVFQYYRELKSLLSELKEEDRTGLLPVILKIRTFCKPKRQNSRNRTGQFWKKGLKVPCCPLRNSEQRKAVFLRPT